MNTLANPEPYRGALTAALPFFLIFVANAFAQDRAEVTEVKRVIVTGSNIPTAEETGPNPVDTYRPADLEKLGIRNATDLTTFLPQEAGGTTNLNISNGGLGTVQVYIGGFLSEGGVVVAFGRTGAARVLVP